ncbi:MAG TPA: VWA domain-containing protein [Gemmatimonadaceae bacterium]|nr:VWA domain-containing protein [Gemmatimonadaceae bacterium]
MSRVLAASRSARRARRALLHSRANAEEQWDRWLLRIRPAVVELESVRRRLELLVAAYYGRAIAVEAVDVANHIGWIRRYVLRAHGERAASDAFPRTDGERILLPRALDASSGEDRAIALYKLLAIEQAERIVRGTVAALPGPDEHPLLRELYLLSEGAAIDARIATTIRGVRPALMKARIASLERRPRFPHLTRSQRAVEALVHQALLAAPETELQELPLATTPADSLAWARERAERIGLERRYERVRRVWHWGTVSPPPWWDPGADMPETDDILRSLVFRAPPLPFTSVEAYGGDGQGDGARLTPKRDGSVAIEESRDGTAEGGAPEGGGATRTGSTPEREHTAKQSDDRVTTMHDDLADAVAGLRARNAPATRRGEQYAEWDYVTTRYRERAVTVHGGRVAEATSNWARTQMSEHAAAIRAIRQRFERLRARRVRLRQQLDGEELDLQACVNALVERRMGRSSDERLYTATRATRQPLAISLLVDVSGSTSSPVGQGQRMIDIEKTALLLASEALAALGDRYSILTFTGRGPQDVRVHTVKEFAESNSDVVRRRIAGLHPGGFTRLGAALRHAAAELTRERVRHRLLLILSDGRPNDLGHYMADYGVEDSRQAINEARARGIHPFCLNVDPEGPEYLARIFGPVGYVTIRRPEQLPRALLQAVRTLIE